MNKQIKHDSSQSMTQYHNSSSSPVLDQNEYYDNWMDNPYNSFDQDTWTTWSSKPQRSNSQSNNQNDNLNNRYKYSRQVFTLHTQIQSYVTY